MSILFLCTGNYYRSRFAELYFRHLTSSAGIDCHVSSRGLRLTPSNPGPISKYTISECEKLGVTLDPPRFPLDLQGEDLAKAQRTIAVKETEHRPLMRERFPEWEDRIEYWQVHDIDCAPPEEALPKLRELVETLFERVRNDF